MFYLPHGRFVFLALFIAVSLTHLFVPKYKSVTKSLLLPAVILYYLTSVGEPSWLLVCAFIASWLGDVLLIKPSNAWFTAGGISFMLSHLLFIAVYVLRTETAEVTVLPVIISALLYIAASAVIIKLISPYAPKKLIFPLFLYLLFNAAMNVFAFMRLIASPSFGTAAGFIGAVLFFVSDCTLFIGKFYEKKKYRTFYLCMGTYISAEFLIAHSMIV